MTYALHNGVQDTSRQFAMIPFDVIEAVQDAKALALYTILKRFANYHTKLAYPTRNRLAEMMGYKTPRPVDEALAILTDLGLVEVVPRYVHTDTQEVIHEERKGYAQQANGYILYDTVRRETPTPVQEPTSPLHGESAPPSTTVIAPLVPQSQPPYDCGLHKIYKDQLDKEQLDVFTPLTPQGGNVPQPKSKPNTRGEFLPDGWQPSRAVIEAMGQELPHLDLWQEHLKFTDYWRSVSGAKARKRDWEATWRNWMRRAGENAPRAHRRGFNGYVDMGQQQGGLDAKAANLARISHELTNGGGAL